LHTLNSSKAAVANFMKFEMQWVLRWLSIMWLWQWVVCVCARNVNSVWISAQKTNRIQV
jgi:hypothetical protein